MLFIYSFEQYIAISDVPYVFIMIVLVFNKHAITFAL